MRVDGNKSFEFIGSGFLITCLLDVGCLDFSVLSGLDSTGFQEMDFGCFQDLDFFFGFGLFRISQDKDSNVGFGFSLDFQDLDVWIWIWLLSSGYWRRS